jgi:hypothetical protein
VSNRFEDFEIPTPKAAPARARRPAIVVTAAIVLLVAGVLNLLVVFLFKPTGASVWLYAALGGLQVLGAILVALLVPAGRTLGLVLAGLGIVLGIVRATDDAASGLMAIALNGFVIYALVAGAPSFVRRSS